MLSTTYSGPQLNLVLNLNCCLDNSVAFRVRLLFICLIFNLDRHGEPQRHRTSAPKIATLNPEARKTLKLQRRCLGDPNMFLECVIVYF